jgi:hypothetical protein
MPSIDVEKIFDVGWRVGAQAEVMFIFFGDDELHAD